jgi:hypothetical protein
MKTKEILKIVQQKPDSYVQIIKAKYRDFYDEVNSKYVGRNFGEKLYKSVYGEKKCKCCGKDTRFNSFIVGYNEYCSKKCSNASTSSVRRDTMIENNKKNRHLYYETKNCLICNQSFESLIFRKQKCCSVKCSGLYVARDDNRINKIKETKLKRYGSATYVNPEKAKKTCVKKYGVDNISKTEYFRNVAREDSKKRFIENISNHKLSSVVLPLFSFEDYKSTDKEHLYKFQCKKCDNIFEDHIDGGHIPRCLKCYPYIAGFSNNEKEIVDFVKSLITDEIVENDRDILGGMELDLYIPSKKFAIEYDGLYWHSEYNGGKGKDYHLNKTKMCESKNIRLIHIFEDEWIYNKNIVKNKIKSILNASDAKSIYARKCKIIEIDDCKSFLNENHIQGDCPSLIKLGAYHNDVLVAVMTFGKKRKPLGYSSKNSNEYELIRFATNQQVVGIAGKLLNYFIQNYKPSKIITYADKRYSVGNLYTKLGFIKIKDTKPNYWYFEVGNDIRWHRFGFAKHTLSKKLKKYDESISEWQNMQLNGYDRIWDCGHIKYELNIYKT